MLTKVILRMTGTFGIPDFSRIAYVYIQIIIGQIFRLDTRLPASLDKFFNIGDAVI